MYTLYVKKLTWIYEVEQIIYLHQHDSYKPYPFLLEIAVKIRLYTACLYYLQSQGCEPFVLYILHSKLVLINQYVFFSTAKLDCTSMHYFLILSPIAIATIKPWNKTTSGRCNTWFFPPGLLKIKIKVG